MGFEQWSRTVVVDTPKSIADQVYDFLKERVLLSDIEAGERLVETKVAELLQISRTPVREAFLRLEQEGLAVRIPQGGIKVTAVTPESVVDVSGVREVLEVYAGRLACDHAAPGDLAELRSIARRAHQVLDDHQMETTAKVKELWRLNTLFHDALYRISGSGCLVKVLNNLRQQVMRFRVLSIQEDIDQPWRDHDQIIQFIEAMAKDDLEELLRRHIRRAAQAALDALARGKPSA